MSKQNLPSLKLHKSIDQYYRRIRNSVKRISINNPDWKSIVLTQESHHSYFTPDLISQIFHSFDQTSLNQLLRKHQSHLVTFNQNYSDQIQARNHLTPQKGLSHYTLPQLITLFNHYLLKTISQTRSIHSLWGITQSQYKICALTNLSSINFTTAITLLSPQYPLLSHYKNTINYVSGNQFSTHYNSTTNIFTITMDQKECPNHTLIGLLHELSHVGFILSQFQQEKNPWLLGKYASELSVAQTLSATLPNISPQLWILYKLEKRLHLVNILFQLLAYSQSTTNPSALYLETLQNAYPQTKLSPGSQYFYLFDPYLISEPIRGLAQVIALIETSKPIAYRGNTPYAP